MIWLKSALAGFAAALIALVAIVLATTAIVVSMSQSAGSGGIGFVSGGLSELLLLPVVLAFALGFSWMRRRLRRRLQL